ncbi:LOW QUALITY PROTEIN: programmed cell death protein 2 [Sceloporus undulatus]|uniref:LOW QUALITY PROTEIN: programmed cell death protein 2 n=1 Tax=Sceloporus undulatus TaxID=8520 RepID=UPI001C4C8510|nr:LOW QUALITY PROTEIN: programmed cell death protein 2 [Sceloporus undulatus]
MASPGVELGFVEEEEAASLSSWRLSREHFPCKVGGRPAWLGERGLPGPGELRCGACGAPLALLLQLYAPDEARPQAFHRSLFLFGCRQGPCYRGGGAARPQALRVFRNQLPRKNDTYSYDPPPEEPPLEPPGPGVPLQLKSGAPLCRVCGCLGPKRCSKCHKAHYCSKDHQLRDWKAGHKVSCLQPDQTSSVIPDHNFLFPEYEIVREPEEMGTSHINEADREDVEKKMKTASANKLCENSESLDEKFLEAMAKHETQDDKIFQKFKERISLEPEQIIRYCRDGEGPLWISGENIPQETDIPQCLCGSKRVFEFQVMPQLLNHLKVDSLEESIDWGILAIYTCAENCSLGSRYIEEFVWKQDISGSV